MPNEQNQPALTLAELKHVGIDKIRIHIPVKNVSPELHRWLAGWHGKDKGWNRFNIPGGDFEDGFLFPAGVYLQHSPQEYRLTIEFNPSRMSDPEGDSLCSVQETHYWVERVIRAVAVVFTPTFIIPSGNPTENTYFQSTWKEDCHIVRLDIARDFYSPFSSFGIRQLCTIKKPYISKDTLYRDGSYIEGMSWGNSKRQSYRYSLYNKSLKHHGERFGGWFRFELQLHYKGLNEYRLRTLAGLNDGRILSCLMTKWDKSHMSADITIPEGTYDIYEHLLEGNSEVKRQTFLGIATAMSLGLPVKLSPPVMRDYRKMGEHAGFELGTSISTLGGKVVHVDFEKGLVVDKWNPTTFTETAFSPDDILGINPISNYLEP